jgi:serine/threonine-protein kinase
MSDLAGDASSVPASEISGGVGELIADRYRVIRALGHGSTGTVYLCEHRTLEKQIAVKVLHRELADNAGLVARFQREAQTAARLDHPNSVHVMDFGQDARGTLYLAMEYIEGRDLGEVLNDGSPMSDERVVDIMLQVLSALSAAHALGIVHRDLKPENILVRRTAEDEEQIKVCDFGIAQLSPIRLAKAGQPLQSMQTRVTGDGMVVGTPAYMSPEQARALELDARSDLYSAGVVLFQLLTRTLPFVSETPMSVAVMHCTTPPPPPSGFGPVNRGLETVCLKALSKTRDARYQTASEMQAALLAALGAPDASRAIVRRSMTPVAARKALSVPPSAGWPVAPPPAGRRAQNGNGGRKGKGKRGRRSQPPAQPPRLIVSSPKPLTRGSVSTAMSVAPTELSVPAVGAAPRRRRTASLLMVAVAATLLALVAVPRFLPDKAQGTTGVTNSEPAHPAPPSAAAPVTSPPALASLPESAPAPPSAMSVTSPASEPRAVSVLAAATPAPRPRRVVARVRKPNAVEEQPTASDAPDPALPTEAADTKPLEILEDRAPEALTAAKTIESKLTPLPDSAPRPAAILAVAPAPVEPVAVASVKTIASNPLAAPAPVAPVKTIPTAPLAAPAPVAPVKTVVAAPFPAPLPPMAAVADGQVIVGNVITHGVPKASLRSALNASAMTRCYQEAQRKGMNGAGGTATLELSTNMGGRITEARVSDGLPKPLRECIEQVARSGHVRDVDTGEAQATVELKFQR